MRWLALTAALVVTTAGVAFVGPTGDLECQRGSHPGVPASHHWADDRTLPPVWACQYTLLESERVLWRAEQYTALYLATGAAGLLLVLLVAFRWSPPPALQGLVIAWLTVATFGAFASYDLVGAWFFTPFVAAPCIAYDLRRGIPGVLRWWWAGGIVLVVWAATVLTSMLWGEMGNPWPGLALGALLGAVVPRFAKYPAEP